MDISRLREVHEDCRLQNAESTSMRVCSMLARSSSPQQSCCLAGGTCRCGVYPGAGALPISSCRILRLSALIRWLSHTKFRYADSVSTLPLLSTEHWPCYFCRMEVLVLGIPSAAVETWMCWERRVLEKEVSAGGGGELMCGRLL